MARVKRTSGREPNPEYTSRLRERKPAKVTQETSTNPITGTRTTTTKRKTHPKKHSHSSHSHGHSERPTTTHHQRRKPGLTDKISGALTKLKGTIEGKPGVKAAGTRRMHGTDGRGSHRTY